MISVLGQLGGCLAWQKLERCIFLGHHKYDKCQTLHDGSAHWALRIDTIFSGLDCTSRSQQCQMVLTETFKFLFDKVETYYKCWLHLEDHEYTIIFYLYTISRK